MTLFINFHFGDVYGDSESWNWELFKAVLATIPVLIGLLIQSNIDKNRRRKIKEEEIRIYHENLKLQLFNFNQHIKAIIGSADQLVPPFKEFSDNIKKTPFEEHILWARVNIPDLFRVDEINKEEIFKAFTLVSVDKVKAATDFRRAYNAIHFYKTIYEFLYSKYDILSEDIYKQKLRFKDNVLTIKKDLTEIVITNPKEEDPYKTINEIIQVYGKLEKIEMASGSSSLQFYIDKLMEPLINYLPQYEKIDGLRELYRKIADNFHLRDDIVNASSQLGELLGGNIDAIPECKKTLEEVNQALNIALAEYYKA
jgi:hypothetical protein